MRLDNVPISVAFTVWGGASFFLGVPAAFPWAAAAYLVSFGALLAVVVPLPEYDHATPVPGPPWIFGLTATIAGLYLFARLAFLAPHELWIVGSVPWLGAALTLLLSWAVVPAVIQPLVFAILRRPTPRGQ